jgi:DNA repair photolyase
MEIELIQTQKVLSPTQIKLAPYAINPYRGCDFGCLYCYSRENKNIKKIESSNYLGIKINAPSILEKELRYKTPERILLGSTTECFQYQELKYRITRKILKLLNNHNIAYTILTKSHLVTSYLPLICKNQHNKIYFTLNMSRDDLIKLFEEKSPNLDSRIKAIKTIIEKKVPLRIHIGPFIPYLSSLEEILALLPKGVSEINVELYHQKMGNFKEILDRIEKKFGKNLRDKIKSIYTSEKNYVRFANQLREEINRTKDRYNIKLFYIVPDFNTFYRSNIDYNICL